MSGIAAVPPATPAAVDTRTSAPPAPVAFHFTQTESFVALLRQLGASLLVSTYQANKLFVVRAAGAGLSMLVRKCPHRRFSSSWIDCGTDGRNSPASHSPSAPA
jgi:hypothetical protein